MTVELVQEIDVSCLHPHPRNTEIYGVNEDISELAKKIQEKGKLDYNIVVTQHNRIISGHRRWQAVKALGWKKVPVEKRTYASEVEELEALLIANVYRDKTTAQRGREYEVWLEVYKAKNKEKQEEQGDKGVLGKDDGNKGGRSLIDTLKGNQNKGIENDTPLVANLPQGGVTDKKPKAPITPKKQPAPKSRDQAANDAGLKAKTADKIVKVNAVIKDLRQKEMAEEAQTLENELNRSADAAYKLIGLPEDQLLSALHKLENKEVKTGKAAILELQKERIEEQAQSSPTKPHAALESWDIWLPKQGLCDLLITDPPYSTDIEDIDAFAQTWLPIALGKIKNSGRAYVCIGAYPHELRAYLNVGIPPHLQLVNVLVWTYKNTLGPQPHNAYKQNWQAILYYAGIKSPPLDCPIMKEQFSVQEINAPDGRAGDHYHAWQKPDELAERLIRHSTKQGDTVLDCFTGTGTFLLAAHRLGRVAYGCDASEKMLQLAEKRGCHIEKGC